MGDHVYERGRGEDEGESGVGCKGSEEDDGEWESRQGEIVVEKTLMGCTFGWRILLHGIVFWLKIL